MVPGSTAVPVTPVVANTPILGSVFRTDPLRCIRRSIVADNQFKILKRLGQNGFDRPPDITLPIVHRHTHSYWRILVINRHFSILFKFSMGQPELASILGAIRYAVPQ